MAAALFNAAWASTVEERLTTVVIAIAVTTLLTGGFFLALGFFKLGGLVRFIPFPVVGGFLAGTGWLLVQGSFAVMADVPLTLSTISILLQPYQLLLWLPGVLLALVLLFGSRYIDRFWVMPGILVGAFILFYAMLLLTGTSIDTAIQQSLLLGGSGATATWHPLTPATLFTANWTAILGQSGNIVIILVLSVVSLLLNASGIELTIRRDVDLNRELRVAGIANIVSGLGGGAIGYHALDLSTLSCRIGARGRLPGLVAGAICALILIAGTPLMAFMPQFILGGLLLFLGLDFLVEWVVDGWRKLPRIDYAIVILILVTIGVTDFLVGVGVGLVATIILFVLKYSRIGVVRHTLSGTEIKSNVERCAYHRQKLRELGQHVYILKLQGFIFFGTANALLEQIRTRVNDEQQAAVRFIVLDFRRITGLDSSAVLSFVKGTQLAEAQNIALVLTNVSEEIKHQLELGGLPADGKQVHFFPDLDRALEWCENQLLQMELITQMVLPVTLRAQLEQNGFEPTNTARLIAFLEQEQVGEGEYLIRQGDETNALYFIEQGEASIYLELEEGKQVRLRTLGPGTVVGELALYLDKTRTASVIADLPTTAYRLTRSALSQMREAEPELAVAFHEFMVRLLAERLVATNQSLEAVLK
jgi:SulP family sulfate permease